MQLLMDIGRGALGMAVLIGICYLLSNNKKAINWRLVIGGLALQLILAILILKVPQVRMVFQAIADGFVKLLSFTEAGANFLFGAWPDNAWLVQEVNNDLAPTTSLALSETGKEVGELSIFKMGYMFAFKVLPTIVFFAAFSAILYYLGILQKIIFGFAFVMSKAMRLSGSESIAAAANVFIGQTEAPLVIKPYLEKMTKSEIMCLMTGGMATIAGGVFALFVMLLGDDSAIHFLTASIISAPAAIVAAKMMYPEDRPEDVNTDLEVPKEKLGNNILDAISLGTTDGVKLAVNVGAMLLVFLALVAMVNSMLFGFGDLIGINDNIASATNGGYEGFTLEYILGMIFAPFAWLLGVPSQDVMVVGQLLGKKTVINEVVAYLDLTQIRDSGVIQLSHKSVLIATYALCGFANFASIGIQIGGIGSIAPGQRSTLTELGIKSLIGGTIACFLTAIIAGMLSSTLEEF